MRPFISLFQMFVWIFHTSGEMSEKNKQTKKGIKLLSVL